LLVNIKNTPQGSGYYTVRTDGTIDFPLAGENVVAAGRTMDEIEESLASAITLYSNPQLEVKVREYTSHKINVSGLVDNPGEKSLQREAVPLFVIKAEAIVERSATKATVTRAQQAIPKTFDLRNSETDSVLIYPGDTVVFTDDSGARTTDSAVYFIGGDIAAAGQRQFLPGITLYQAVVASGGSKHEPKKAIIRRKNDKGMFAVSEHNLRAIRDGKVADPALAAGDVIEIRN
jgi:polysaccharide export outer membrane protein